MASPIPNPAAILAAAWRPTAIVVRKPLSRLLEVHSHSRRRTSFMSP